MITRINMLKRSISLIVLFLAVSIAHGQSNERDRVIGKLSKTYDRVKDEKRVLFELDKFRVIRAEFNKQRSLIELAVVPKYYFDEDRPEWEATDDFVNMTKAEFETLSSELAKVKPIGKKVEAVNRIAIVTNMTAWYSEYFEKASLTWGVVADLRKSDDSYEVRWFRFKYGSNASKPTIRELPELKF